MCGEHMIHDITDQDKAIQEKLYIVSKAKKKACPQAERYRGITIN